MTRVDPSHDLKQAMIAEAQKLGFVDIGFADPTSIPEAPAQLEAFIASGYHGDMEWLAERAPQRGAPHSLWPDVRSVIMLSYNYGPEIDPLGQLCDPTRGAISVYAQGDDYHELLKKKLKSLARWFVEQTGNQVKVFVDTAPVMEKPLAQAGGLGWQGKHTNLVSRRLGSWAFLGSIMTDYAFPPDPPEIDHCGSCQACLDICPTNAFPRPYQMDARRCISYLTIEYSGIIPDEFRAAMGNRIYGCDDCLAVCPWNKYAQHAHDIALQPRAENYMPDLAELARLDDAAFRARFRKSPIKRIGRDRFIRNVLVALGNGAKTPSARQAVIDLLSDQNPVIRASAAWALSQIDVASARNEYKRRMADESDTDVRLEWEKAMGAR